PSGELWVRHSAVMHDPMAFFTETPLPRSPLFPYTTLFRSLHVPGIPGAGVLRRHHFHDHRGRHHHLQPPERPADPAPGARKGDRDRKSTRLNSSHVSISYAVFCLKKKTNSDPDPNGAQAAY